MGAVIGFAVVVTHEIMVMQANIGIPVRKWPVFIAIIGILLTVPVLPKLWNSPIILACALCVLAGHCIELWRSRTIFITNSWGATGRVIVFILSTMPFFYLLRENIGFRFILFSLLIVWSGDIAALIAGTYFGRRPLLVRVSPKKTWEGSIAAILVSASLGIGLHQWVGIPLLFSGIFALIISVVGQIGDLHESFMKRMCHVKDSAKTLPGHGGFYDRLDSSLFMAPVAYSLFYICLK